MADLSQLSDEELRKLYAQSQTAAPSADLSLLSDDQLKSLYAKSRAAPPQNVYANLGGTLQFGPWDTGLRIPNSVEAGLVGAGRTFDRLIEGVKQPFLSDAAAAKQKAEQDYNTKAYEPLSKAYPVSTFVGEVAPTLVAASPLAMAGLGAAEYGSPLERAGRAGMGYVGGKLGEGVARMFGPESMRAVPGFASDFVDTVGNKWGIPTTPGQNGSKAAAIAESVLSNLPFGGAVNRARDASYQAFNQAVTKTFGENASNITPELLGDALERSGKQIGDIMVRARAALSPSQAQEVAQLSSVIADLAPGDAGVLTNRLTKLIDGTTNGNALSGQSLRMLDSSLGRIMGGAESGDARFAAARLQNILRDAATDSLSAEDAAALKLARQQNFNVRQVADATKQTPDTLSPSRLLTQVNNYQRNAKYGGGNDLAELAQWAKGTLPDSIPNSGTAQRLFYQKLLTNPVSAGAGLLGLGAGSNALGITDSNPAMWMAPVAVPWLASHALAGKPVSEFTKKMLMRAGGAGLLAAY